MKKMCGNVWCYTGPEEESKEVFAPVLEVGTPALHGVGTMPYPVLQSAFDPLYPSGHQWYWKADFITELSDEAIEQHTRHAEVPTLQATMHLYPIDGAAHRVGKNETPWSYREANWGMVIVGVDPKPGQQRYHHRVGAGVLGSYTPALGRWGIHQHDDGGGAGSRESLLPRQLRAAGGDQAQIRPDEPLPRQPEH